MLLYFVSFFLGICFQQAVFPAMLTDIYPYSSHILDLDVMFPPQDLIPKWALLSVCTS